MPDHEVTAAQVQQWLRLVAGIDIDGADAAAVARLVETNLQSLERLDQFDVGDVRPAVLFDPAR